MLFGLLIVAIVVLVMWQAGRWAAAQSEVDATLASTDVDTLDYVVPEGQDPAVVLAALQANGLTAAADNIGARQLVHIDCDPDELEERERAREAIEGVQTSSLHAGVPFDAGPVRFLDER